MEPCDVDRSKETMRLKWTVPAVLEIGSVNGEVRKMGMEMGGRNSPWCGATYVPRRGIVALLLFLGFSVIYALRVCISIAAEPGPSVQNSSATMFAEYRWSNTEAGVVLGAFFDGYVWTQVAGGLLAARYGGKPVLISCIALASLLTAVTPLVASYFPLLVACRACLGAVEGVCCPAVMSMLAEWAAPAERTMTLGFVFAGAYIGNVVTFLAGGWMLDAFGWRSIFYALAGLGVGWCVLFSWLVSPSPSCAHPFLPISDAELAHLVPPLDDVSEPLLRLADEAGPGQDSCGGGTRRGGECTSVPWAKIAQVSRLFVAQLRCSCNCQLTVLYLTGGSLSGAFK